MDAVGKRHIYIPLPSHTPALTKPKPFSTPNTVFSKKVQPVKVRTPPSCRTLAPTKRVLPKAYSTVKSKKRQPTKSRV